MQVINSIVDFDKTERKNCIISNTNKVRMDNSQIRFSGENNILFIEDNLTLKNTTLSFNGSNSVCYLSSNRFNTSLNLSVNNNQFFFFGKNCYLGGVLTVILSEEKSAFIGDDCMFSYGVTLRNADAHLIYDCNTHERINFSKSIFIGDHCWIGQSSMILKGTMIHSGAIIGAGSVVPGKEYFSNNVYGGNPCKLIRKDVFWDGSCVHPYTQEQTQRFSKKESDEYIFAYRENEYIDFNVMEKTLETLSTKGKLEFFDSLSRSKNRFASNCADQR